MKTLFPMALLCLLITSCTKEDVTLLENEKTENRTSANITATYLSPNGTTTTIECLKVESSAIDATTISAKIYLSTTNVYSVTVQSITLAGVNGTVKCTNATGAVYQGLPTAKLLPASTTEVKLILGANNITSSTSFVGEDSDGL
jgi:hypothetical protein